MRVLQMLHDSFYPQICGNATDALAYHKMLEQNFQDYLFIWNRDRPEEEVVKGVKVFNVQGNRKDIRDRLRNLITDLEIDVVILHTFNIESHSSVIFEPEFANVRKVLVQHGFTDKLDHAAPYVHRIIHFQRENRIEYLRQGVPGSIMTHCHVPLDTDKFLPRRDVKTEENSLLYVGRIERGKQIELILPYLKRLDATYTVVGPTAKFVEENGAKEDKLQRIKEYEEELKGLIKVLGLEDRVTFTGVLRGDALVEQYNKHQIFLLLSNFDCYSNVLKEAIACGTTPVVLQNRNSYKWAWYHAYVEPTLQHVVRRVDGIFQGREHMPYDGTFVEEFSYPYVTGRVTRVMHEAADTNREVEVLSEIPEYVQEKNYTDYRFRTPSSSVVTGTQDSNNNSGDADNNKNGCENGRNSDNSGSGFVWE